jgi:predicted ATPase
LACLTVLGCGDQPPARTNLPFTDLFLRWGKRHREGGNRNFSNDGTESNHSIDPLKRALRLSFEKKIGAGYFLRAKSFFNTTSYMNFLRFCSDILMTLILSFEDGAIHEVDYEVTSPAQIVRRFLTNAKMFTRNC